MNSICRKNKKKQGNVEEFTTGILKGKREMAREVIVGDFLKRLPGSEKVVTQAKSVTLAGAPRRIIFSS